MSSWQGANIRVPQRKRPRNAETVEATLHRLTNAYSVAMECVGLFHKDQRNAPAAARAARDALEQAVVSDPWIQATLHHQPIPVRSAGHRHTVAQLAYLALLNYGDLLLAGLGKQNNSSSAAILDRGVVKPVQDIPLWDDRPSNETVRLAVESYLDAVGVDGTDPTTWLKLACAARRLGDEKYQRLVRYALERAVSVRPRHLPPHALAVRALADLRAEESSNGLVMNPPPFEEPKTLVLQIPRNSWTALGRLLSKTARDSATTNERLQLKLSPLLVLNANILTHVCSFLGTTSALEATCRAMSASVLAARTLLNRQQRRRASTTAAAVTTPTPQLPPTTPQPETNPQQGEATTASEKQEAVSKRVSKRVQSQIISSGKRTQRTMRRHSVEYCLLAATFGCTSSDPAYRALLKVDFSAMSTNKPVTSNSNTVSNQDAPTTTPATTSTATMSLQDFVLSCDVGITPLKCLFRFVAKCSVEIATVVASDPGGALLVSSCLLDCLNCMVRRTRLNNQLICSWSAAPCYAMLASRDDLLAIDILHAELRFQRCEAALTVDGSYDGDANFVSTVIPRIRTTSSADAAAAALRVRYAWLAANYYLWRARLATSLGESRDAEAEGLRYLEETKAHLPENGAVLTPHLASPRRKGLHWRELSMTTLTTFEEEIKASSIVLVAQEQFLEVTSRFSGVDESQPLTEEDKERLYGIGAKLMERYDHAFDSPESKHSELVDDFLTIHGDVLTTWLESEMDGGKECENLVDSWFVGLLPIDRIENVGQLLYVVESPCILTILVTCCLVRDGQQAAIARLLANMVSAVVSSVESIGSKNSGGATAGNFDSDGDDYLSDSDIEDDARTALKSGKLQQLGTLVPTLLNRLMHMATRFNQESQTSLTTSSTFSFMFRRCLQFVADWYQHSGSDDGEDLDTLYSLSRVFEWACSNDQGNNQALSKAYVDEIMKIIIKQHHELRSLSKTKAKRRSELFRITRKRADVIASGCCSLGVLLGKDLVRVHEGTLTRSALLKFEPASYRSSVLAQFTEALSSLWRAVVSGSCSEGEKPRRPGWNLDQFGRDRLRVPLALAIVVLCGSGSCTELMASSVQASTGQGQEAEVIALTEFYDTDSSATEWVKRNVERTSEMEEIVRVIAQAVSCISLTFDAIMEKEARSFDYVKNYITEWGPLLPLVVARIQNHFSKLIFGLRNTAVTDFVRYPVGTRSIGNLIDTTLYKAYRCLHGFSIAPSDTTSSTITTSSSTFLPEDIGAAAMLFRCLTRVYTNGRKLPPKAALETVAAALPKPCETPKSRLIRDFLFTTKSDKSFNLHDLISEGRLEIIDDQLDLWRSEEERDLTDEAMFVRHGLTELVSQATLPKCQDTGELAESRSSATHLEEEICRKFFAIIENMGNGDALRDGKEWFTASQCLTIKADTVADRIGLTKGFARGQCFSAKHSLKASTFRKPLATLLDLQDKEAYLKEKGWVPTLGFDLSAYATYAWSSLSSLEDCTVHIGRSLREQAVENSEEELKAHVVAWNDLRCRFEKENYESWQTAWGGIFVASLREIAFRCLQLALVSAYKATSPNPILISEIVETIGLNFYVEISASQAYGFPMHTMPNSKKRTHLQDCLSCMEHIVATRASANTTDETHLLWDIHFMIGKCHEKIARTLDQESFLETHPRGYFTNMKKSLEAYSVAKDQALSAEEKGDIIEEQGGSAHGAPEAVYRLHASRLKCLISAASCRDHERELAEEEALHLTECHWFTEPNGKEAHLTIRTRVWNVLVDVVNALAKLRLEHSHFHRSVYRHAQALMWAPMLFDPVRKGADGSLGFVPPTAACAIRGLNDSTDAANSALAVLSVLFGKRRQQLVGVWLTPDGTSTPFHVLNNATRKYDSLRGKYISAYLECLRLCRERKGIDTFLKWALSAGRDLPSTFSLVSVGDENVHSASSHTNNSLVRKPSSMSSLYFLTEVKRQANSALSNVILHDLTSAVSKERTEAWFEEQHKIAYACYLRLNCKPEELAKLLSWKHRRSSGIYDVIETLTTVYLRTTKDATKRENIADWSGESQLTTLMFSAVEKSRERFPSLTGSYSSFKSKPKQKQKGDERSGADNKRKDLPMVKKKFEVAVPEDAAEGETFFANIMVGSTLKKIRLTVPAGSASSLRFALDVPAESSDESNPLAKKSKIED